MNMALWIKFASIAVHAEELIDAPVQQLAVAGAALFDVAAIRGLLADKDVRAFLDSPKNAVMLPLKRSAR